MLKTLYFLVGDYGGDIGKRLRTKTGEKAGGKITRSYGMLNEPSTQFSPQMREITNFFGGGAVNEDELDLAKRIVTAGNPVEYAEFVNAVVDGDSKRIVLASENRPKSRS